MIKHKFNISPEEKIRILQLHEHATKKHYLLNEIGPTQVATQVTAGTPASVQTNVFPATKLGDKFPVGQYDSPAVKQQILTLKPQIEQFIKSSDMSKFDLKITAGESQITNPKGFETKGSLALARANTAKKYFEELYKDLIDNGVLTISSPTGVTEVTIGQTKYYPGSTKLTSTNADQHKWYNDNIQNYNNEQFVDFTVTGQGQKNIPATSATYVCNFKAEAGGGFASKDVNFLNQSKTLDLKNLPDGTKINLSLVSFTVPDLLLVQAGGNSYSTGWVGSSSFYMQYIFATILGNTYNGAPPFPFPQDVVRAESQKDMEDIRYDFQTTTNMKEIFGHVLDLNWKKKPSKLVEEIKWYKFTKNPMVESLSTVKGYENNGGKTLVITKDATFDSLNYYVYSPIGITQWKLFGSCG